MITTPRQCQCEYDVDSIMKTWMSSEREGLNAHDEELEDSTQTQSLLNNAPILEQIDPFFPPP
jgi:hypothetical protein